MAAVTHPPAPTDRPRILAPPGVFPPHSDTWMLADAMLEHAAPHGDDVLDLCAGSGALAVTAALAGARRAVAVDISRRAVLAARVNGGLNGARVEGRRGDLFDALAEAERFDLIVSNPPYLPSLHHGLPQRGLQRAWQAGPDGRVLLDRICAGAANRLAPGGSVLLVHSSVCDTGRTLELLDRGGLAAEVLQRHRGPLGPRLSARADQLEAAGLLGPGEREEDLVVVRGRDDRTDRHRRLTPRRRPDAP